MKKEKWLAGLLLGIFLLGVGTFYGKAESGKTVQLRNIRLSLEAPEGGLWYTREDVVSKKEELAQYGHDAWEERYIMEQEGIHFKFLADDGSYSIGLFVEPAEEGATDYRDLDGLDMEWVCQLRRLEAEHEGYTVTESWRCPKRQTVLVRLKYYDFGFNYEVYETRLGGQYYSFFGICWDEESTETMYSTMESLVDSALFGGVSFLTTAPTVGSTTTRPQITALPDSTISAGPGFDLTYTDSKTGLCFQVPEGWRLHPQQTLYQGVDVRYQSADKMDLLILYGSVDAYSQLSDQQKQGLTREDMNSKGLTITQLSALLGLSEGVLSQTQYGETDFFTVDADVKKTNLFQVAFNADYVQMFHLENGWLSVWQFNYEPYGGYYEQFQELLKTVTHVSAHTSPLSQERKPIENYAVSFFIPLLVFPIFPLLYRFLYLRAPMSHASGLLFACLYGVGGLLVFGLLLLPLSSLTACLTVVCLSVGIFFLMTASFKTNPSRNSGFYPPPGPAPLSGETGGPPTFRGPGPSWSSASIPYSGKSADAPTVTGQPPQMAPPCEKPVSPKDIPVRWEESAVSAVNPSVPWQEPPISGGSSPSPGDAIYWAGNDPVIPPAWADEPAHRSPVKNAGGKKAGRWYKEKIADRDSSESELEQPVDSGDGWTATWITRGAASSKETSSGQSASKKKEALPREVATMDKAACPYCRKPLLEKSRFCPYCGHRL